MTQQTRNHKIKSHYGANEYFIDYKKNGGTVDRRTFGIVLESINSKIGEEILNGYSFKIPSRLGVLAVTKKKEFIVLNDEGKVVTNRPVDFKSTMELWAKDPQAKAEKKLIRFLNKHTGGYIFSFRFNKSYATFKNKTVYNLNINRELKRTLAKRIFNGFDINELVSKPRYAN